MTSASPVRTPPAWTPAVAGAVAAGGALGALLRLAVTGVGNGSVQPACPPNALCTPVLAFPWGTLAVNLLGAFLLGALSARAAGPLWSGFWRTGVLGAFTTTSAFALEAVALSGRPWWPPFAPLSEHGLVQAGAYVAATLIGGGLLAALGIRLGQRSGATGAAP